MLCDKDVCLSRTNECLIKTYIERRNNVFVIILLRQKRNISFLKRSPRFM